MLLFRYPTGVNPGLGGFARCGMGPLVIDRETIDRVLDRTDIAALVGETVKLERRGRRWLGLCPFHKEKTPSFTVNDDGFFYCFGCSASGDAIKFVQETERLSFSEALRRLADRANVEIKDDRPEPERRRDAEVRRARDVLLSANEAAADFFERMLAEHPLAQHAHAELARRGVDVSAPNPRIDEALRAFRVGYAPCEWEALAQHLRARGVSAQAAEQVGLLGSRRSGNGHYDRFRHRLMFAVLDAKGRVIAFSGRALTAPTPEEVRAHGYDPGAHESTDKPAKYVNSIESPVYKKREVLFGIHQASQDIRQMDCCVVVEGNFDVFSLHAQGLRNVVAPLGTAFTPEQAAVVRRYTGHVVFLFDGDAAGRRAVTKVRDTVQQAGLTARVASLPNGVDPDDFVRTRGPEALRNLLAHSRGLAEYLIEEALGNLSEADTQSRTSRLQAARALIDQEPDPTARELLREHANSTVRRLLAVSNDRFGQAIAGALGCTTSEPAPRSRVGPARARSRDRRGDISKEVLGALLDHPELFASPDVTSALGAAEGDLVTAIAAVRAAWVHGSGHVEGTAAAGGSRRRRFGEQVLATLAPSARDFAAARLAAPTHDTAADAKVVLLQNLDRLRARELAREVSDTAQRLHRAEAAGDDQQALALLRERQEALRVHLSRRHQVGDGRRER